MGRGRFPSGKQSAWINKILKKSELNTNQIAKISGVSGRTFRDWRREKFTIPKEALLKLSLTFKVPIPLGVKFIDDFWYVTKGARKGAFRRLEIYGPPGTPDGRRKGGIISQQRRRKNPEKYRFLGCNVRKKFPNLHKSKDLAEIVGIILGDGGLTHYQLKITLDRKKDKQYALYVQELLKKVLGERPFLRERKQNNTITLTISGVELIENLSKIGVNKGNKVLRQVDFPEWISRKSQYQIACVRGLFDTDGGIYFHKHWTKGIKYRNLGLCFTSWSKPLLRSVSRVLAELGIKHSVYKEAYLYVYNLEDIKKFFRIFQPHNQKFFDKLKYHENHSRIIGKVIKGGVA